jgi:hypothetical protein
MGLLGFAKGIGQSLGLVEPETPDYSQAMQYLSGLPDYQVVGQISPESYVAGPSAYENIKTDPVALAAQQKALASMQKIGDEGGMTLEDKVNLAQIAQDELNQNRGIQEATSQNAAARGISGSGLEMAKRLSADQGTANRQSTRDMEVAAQAQARALQAIQNSGTMGSQLRTQDYNEQQNLANARDAITAFNLKNRQAIDTANLANQQRIAEANVGGKRDVGFKKAGYGAQDAQNQANAQNSQAKAAGNTFGNLVSFGVGMPGGYSAMTQSADDKESKKTPWSY